MSKNFFCKKWLKNPNSSNENGAFTTEDDFNSFDYDPLIGLVAGRDYDPETGEIFDDVFEDGEDTEENIDFVEEISKLDT